MSVTLAAARLWLHWRPPPPPRAASALRAVTTAASPPSASAPTPSHDLTALRDTVAGAAGPFYARLLVDGAPGAGGAFDDAKLARLQAALGHSFTHAWLLRAALLHRSYAAETYKTRCGEMLAWLGDAALHGGLTAALLAAYPTSPLGELTNARSILVSRASLAVLGRQLDLGSALLVGSSFAAAASGAGGATKNMVAEAAEAVLGAVAVDAGPDAAVAAYWRVAGPLPERLDDVMAAAMAARAAE